MILKTKVFLPFKHYDLTQRLLVNLYMICHTAMNTNIDAFKIYQYRSNITGLVLMIYIPFPY